ncbi:MULTISPECIES: tyrosine-type recombinase/integrase [Rhodobacterales]|uniref:Tyrosine-type recombinase/integrase n=1 Tax=Psychromarinibacter halotolerans TaxID=1775175 RepID=A0ABV7GRI8_9RHOB|nr:MULTISPECIES: site-specific integrase [Rhodobacterales]MCA0846068.1 site-specific integrase [Salipiger thiooxidans]MDF0597736.1 site-specific integrase [Psychromarinibacter halotolerans]
MRSSDLPKGVHRVRRKVSAGYKYHFYAWRGGPKFWEDMARTPRVPDFFHAFAASTSKPERHAYLVAQLVDEFLSSDAMPPKARSREDVELWVKRFQVEFGEDPVAMFEEPASRAEFNAWRKRWIHSPKQYDMAGTHAVKLLNWAVSEGRIKEHHCNRLKKLYSSNRSEIVWTPADIEAFKKVAPGWVQRILLLGCETGLRVSDLVQVRVDHFEDTRSGKRLRFKTGKRGRVAYIPVTTGLAELVEATPAGQETLLVSQLGHHLSARWASNQITKWRREAKIPPWEDGREKTLADTRGTAATRLLNADLSLRQIATLMGWSVRYASQVIEIYARVSPDESDEVSRKLERAKQQENLR